jgi:hypothetical protein
MLRRLLACLLLCLMVLPVQAYTIYVPIYVPPAQPGNYEHIHTIGVVSAVGGNLVMHRFNEIFDTTDRTRDIRDWKLDDAIRETARRYLSPKFTLIDIPVDPITVTDAVTPTIFGNSTAPLRNFLKTLNHTDLDAYLVFRPYSVADGKWGLSLDLRKDETTTYAANYEIDLVDAHSFDIIASATSRIRQRPGQGDYFPELTLKRGFPTDDKLNLDESALALLKESFATMLLLTETETLRELQFGVPLPRPGNRILAPTPPGQLRLPQARGVAVISALGETMSLTYRGTLGRKSLATAPVADWHLDEQVESMVAGALDKRFTLVPVEADRTKLSKLEIPFDRASLDKQVDGLPSAPGIDAYILVLPYKFKLEGDYDEVSGPGMWHRGLIDSTKTGVFMNYMIVVVDAHTGKPRWIQAGADGSPLLGQWVERPVADAAWPEKGPPSPEQIKMVQDAITALMADSVPESLLRLGLTGLQEVPARQAMPAPPPKTL